MMPYKLSPHRMLFDIVDAFFVLTRDENLPLARLLAGSRWDLPRQSTHRWAAAYHFQEDRKLLGIVQENHRSTSFSCVTSLEIGRVTFVFLRESDLSSTTRTVEQSPRRCRFMCRQSAYIEWKEVRDLLDSGV